MSNKHRAPVARPDFLKDYAAVRSVWEERPWRFAWAASKKADLVYAHSHSFRWRYGYIGKQPKFKELTQKMKKSFRNIGKQSKFKTTYAKNEAAAPAALTLNILRILKRIEKYWKSWQIIGKYRKILEKNRKHRKNTITY